MAASAGGLNALTQVLAALPADFPAAIVVVQQAHERAESIRDLTKQNEELSTEEPKAGAA